uniref:LAGLIDADG endonuclease n=1 Tax=Morchella brunnea TaxID=1174671 RepID=A0A8K1I5M2_9PEZI|nr:LAGLIDADG endonuclease [Morchella brunnea]UBU98540.1 LAGLIDADG endonuclease [Morchella brunnea]
MRTNKNFTLHKLIDWLNTKNKERRPSPLIYFHTEINGGEGLNIEKKGLNTNSLISDAWLSGFIEADAHFSVRATESGKYPKIECKFELTQRQIDHNNNDNLFFLEEIAAGGARSAPPLQEGAPLRGAPPLNYSYVLLNLLDSKKLILNIELELLI